MSEKIDALPEFQPTEPNEIVATVIKDWLTAEKISSYDDNNAGLNEYKRYASSQGLAWDDDSNAFTIKGRGHYNRLARRTNEIDEDTANDTFLATQLFDALMSLSGHYRLQCVVRADSKQQYMDLRYGPAPLGISIPEHVDQRLTVQYGELPSHEDLKKPVVHFADIKLMTTTANEYRLALMKELFDRKRIIGTRKAIYAGKLVASQALWLDTAVDHILYSAAKNEGNLAKVPFLEPKSITFAKLIYPLAGEAPYFQEEKAED